MANRAMKRAAAKKQAAKRELIGPHGDKTNSTGKLFSTVPKITPSAAF
jgi:hypothetical protein